MQSLIKISNQLSIPLKELRFTASRSSGPGGQNVNKVNTRVTLWFDVANSPSLSDGQKELIRSNLSTRINREGILRVVSQKHRTQASNRDEAIERFASLVGGSLRRVSPRRKTSISKAARERRLEEKRHRGALKKERSRVDPEKE